MKHITKILSILGLTTTLSTSFAYAQGHENSAIRVMIDQQGTPYLHKDDNVGTWQAIQLPYYQKAIAASGGYFHYRHESYNSPGYAFDEEATFAVGEYGMIFRYQNDAWQHIFGCWDARDVSSHSPKYAYCVNASGDLKRFNLNNGNFGGSYGIDGKKITKVDVNYQGDVWALTQDNEVYVRRGDHWSQVEVVCPRACSFKDIAVGAGQIYLTAHIVKNTLGEQQVYQLNGSKLEKFGDFYNIEVDRDNTIWAISNESKTLHYKHPGMINFIEDHRINSVSASDIGG
ncbi:hypothetical protein N473_09700 [Pseudoalteromonas luteoviolacea CPMOR-1]|uniref:Uncharacterized protein n=1 Tax=Pseudoalteromonas luteoviolacea CPMOR-1 TaxID=1365248 RepID=A0A161YVF8_9GAMM|nr:hypothetical protein [Pseudoalteromonas luteoviolacea]KZN66658.1 hypothetical protein N473_09700 [Pseudoalteromonas luteoviolacea CPMOR-1]